MQSVSLRACVCGRDFDPERWAALPLFTRLTAAELSSLVTSWPAHVVVEVRVCTNCGHQMSRLQAPCGTRPQRGGEPSQRDDERRPMRPPWVSEAPCVHPRCSGKSGYSAGVARVLTGGDAYDALEDSRKVGLVSEAQIVGYRL
jgi:hypothetical protein